MTGTSLLRGVWCRTPHGVRSAVLAPLRRWWFALAAAVLLCPASASSAEALSPEQRQAVDSLADADLPFAKAADALAALTGVTDEDALVRVVTFAAASRDARVLERAGVVVGGAGDRGAKAVLRVALGSGLLAERVARCVSLAARVQEESGRLALVAIATKAADAPAALAIRALGARREPPSRGVVVGAFRERGRPVSSSAASALGRLRGDVEAQDLLWTEVQRESDTRLGDACAVALIESEGAARFAKEALSALAARPRSGAFDALAKVATAGAAAIPGDAVLSALQHTDDRVVQVACDVAGAAGRADAAIQRRLLQMARKSRRWQVSVAAWLALGRTGADQVADEVAACIGASGEASYWAIQCAARDPRGAYRRPLLDAAADSADPVRRELAAIALRPQPDRQATCDDLLRAGEQTRIGRRAATLLSLGAQETVEAFDTLVAELGRPRSAASRAEVAGGLERLTGHRFGTDVGVWRGFRAAVGDSVAPASPAFDRAALRRDAALLAARGVTPETEAAVEAGLAWLAAHQRADGRWSGAKFADECPDGGCRGDAGADGRDPAYTGLACLAFLGAGYSHETGPYRDVVRAGLEALIAGQTAIPDEDLAGQGSVYEAAIVAHALSDAYALTRAAWLREGAQRAIDRLVRVQAPGGGWRYGPRAGEGDTSVLSWVLLASVAARGAGLDVAPQVFVCSDLWIDRVSEPVPPGAEEPFVPAWFKDGQPYETDVRTGADGRPREFRLRAAYRPPADFRPAPTAIALVARLWLGRTRAHPACIGFGNELLATVPSYGSGLPPDHAHYPYTWYYGTLAMYQMGGGYWTRWRDVTLRAITENQIRVGHGRGSWTTPKSEAGLAESGGRVFTTTMAILALETVYRFQPYLERRPLRQPAGK